MGGSAGYLRLSNIYHYSMLSNIQVADQTLKNAKDAMGLLPP